MNRTLCVISLFVFNILAVFAIDNTALVVVDLQDKFFERAGNFDSDEHHTIVKNNEALMTWAVENDIPVLVFEFGGYGPTTSSLQDIYLRGTYKTVIKYVDGGFSSHTAAKREALEFLADHQVTDLIVSGINGPFCVYSTVQGALSSKYNVLTAADVVADFNRHPATFPNDQWWFTHSSFKKYPTYKKLISEVEKNQEPQLAATGS